MSLVSSPFVWRDHILPLGEKDLRKHTKKGFFGGVDKEALDQYNIWWRAFSEFFDEMQARDYCEQSYIELFDPTGRLISANLKIKGDKSESFYLDEEPVFGLDKKERKITTFKVSKGSNEFELILHGHPSQEINTFEPLNVNYKFEVTIPIGDSDFIDKRVGNRYHSAFFSDNSTYYGQVGKVYFRSGDKLFEDLLDKVMGHMTLFPQRRGLEISASVYNGQRHVYNGLISSTGSFPFFLHDEKDRQKERLISPPPVESGTR